MLLEVNITKQLPDFSSTVKFNMVVEKCGIFGSSGSGKSTLMNMLAGLIEPDTGFIRLGGITLFDRKKKINLPPDKRKIGVVFQQGHLFPHMNVQKNLFYGLKRRTPEERKIDPDQLIDVLELQRLLKRNVTRLSGGEKQRVAIGRTILACPDLILMDEPLTGLDRRLKFQIIPHLQRVFGEFSIPLLFISHSLEEMRLMTRDVLIMDHGRVEATRSSEELARTGSSNGSGGYANLLQLSSPKDLGDLIRFRWNRVDLMLVKTHQNKAGLFSLNGRDILLFKKHPEAASARNMLPCTVKSTYQTDWLVGVELDCQGSTLIAEIVPQSVNELDVRPGRELVAVIKASAFQRLF